MHRINLVLKIVIIFVLVAGQSFWVKLSSVNAAPENRDNALSFPAQMNKRFTPISIVSGGTSTISVTIFNPNSFPLTGAHYHDYFPAGITLANPVDLTITGCGSAQVTSNTGDPPPGSPPGNPGPALAPGNTGFRMDFGTVPAQVGTTPGQCTVTVDVTSTTPGNLINTIPAGELDSYGDDAGTIVPITSEYPASATLNVIAVQPPSLSKAFAPNTIAAGGTSTLTITIRNNDSSNPLTQVTLTDTLPTNGDGDIFVASPVTTSLTGCGPGTLTDGSGGSIRLRRQFRAVEQRHHCA